MRQFHSERDKHKYYNSLSEEQKYDALCEILFDSESVVFLGGAGVSTESGIPDFRSKNGLYKKTESRFRRYKPEYLLSHDCLKSKPEIFFDYYRRNLDVRKAEPNTAHRLLAQMEASGRLQGVIAGLTSLASIVAPLAISTTYFATRSTFPGLVWIGGAALYLVCVPLLTLKPGNRIAA